MNQNMGRLIRYILIIQKLSGNARFVPAEIIRNRKNNTEYTWDPYTYEDPYGQYNHYK